MVGINVASPKISVIIPTYNRAKELEIALISLINQTNQNWEGIIIDNNSTDDTDNVVRNLNDSRLKLLKINNNGNIAASRNTGIRESTGKFVAFLDSDDYWANNKLQECLDHFTDNVDLIYHDLEIVDKTSKWSKTKIQNSRHLSSPAVIDLLVNGNCLMNSSVMVRKTALLEVGCLNESESMIGAEDYNAWLKIAEKNRGFLYVESVLGYYLSNPAGVSSQKDMSIPTRHAISEFFPLLSEREKMMIEAKLNYISGRHAFINKKYLVANQSFNLISGGGSLSIKLKILYMRIYIKLRILMG